MNKEWDDWNRDRDIVEFTDELKARWRAQPELRFGELVWQIMEEAEYFPSSDLSICQDAELYEMLLFGNLEREGR